MAPYQLRGQYLEEEVAVVVYYMELVETFVMGV